MSPNASATNTILSPIELRAVFGQNLRILCQKHSSISSICRDLGINRTQFNRYLSGESFPRPDVLHKICIFFKPMRAYYLSLFNKPKREAKVHLATRKCASILAQKKQISCQKFFPAVFFVSQGVALLKKTVLFRG